MLSSEANVEIINGENPICESINVGAEILKSEASLGNKHDNNSTFEHKEENQSFRDNGIGISE